VNPKRKTKHPETRKVEIVLRNLLVVIMALASTVLYGQNELPINVIFPSEIDTVSGARVRIAGNTTPGAVVRINGERVKVYGSGAFVDRLELEEEWNRIRIEASYGNSSSEKELMVYRMPAMQETPEKPTRIEAETVYPNVDMVLFSGDLLNVRFKGSPGGRAVFSINKLCKNVPMTELEVDDAYGFRGIYSGMVRLTTDKFVSGQQVEIELRGIDGDKEKFKTDVRVEVRTGIIPLVGELVEDAYLRNGMQRWSVVNTLPAGTRLQLSGKIGDVYKVRLSAASYGYVAVKDVRLMPAGTPIPSTTTSLPVIRCTRDWLNLSMPISTPVPFLIEQSMDPAWVELTLFGAHLTSQWITYPSSDTEIERISWSQPSADVFKLKVHLNQEQQWGHRVKVTDRKMVLQIRRTPAFAGPSYSPVRGLTFALDAGHGGEEKGAVGATGLMEKDVNLQYTEKLAKLLENAGANVVLTRTVDSTMTLKERVDIARDANAHIFCWLHNNSIGSGSNPTAVRGTSTYFTVPQNKQLSRKVYDRLLELGLDPFGYVQSTYYVTRQTDMLIVLVEGLFLSHPLDEMLLMEDRFLDSLAKAVFLGLEDFCREQRDRSAQ
jgi:N-acetylmuramoyl-L-alanine amidase